MTLKRRDFLKAGMAGALAGAATMAPAIVRAESKQKFRWKMTNAYGPGAPFYTVGPGSATDFCKMVETMSGGRLKIKHYAAGELIPALEGFDAVSQGTVEMNWGNAYFWAGKTFPAQYFTTVPFGMNFQGMNAWIRHGGGQELWDEVYAPFNVIGMPAGNTGVQMTGWFREPVEKIEDFNGLRMRIPGLAGKVYETLGVSVKLLPGGEIFPALERGVIDAAEFVGPYQDRRMGLHKAARYYYTTGWSEPSNTTELLVNKEAWAGLPEDLQAIVRAAAEACNLISHTWSEANNSEALEDLVTNYGVEVRTLSPEIVARLKTVTMETLESHAAADPMVRKVHDSYFAFKQKHDAWQARSETVVQTQL
ncbi:TRAP transporter substrate-binding protein [Thioalbus denitrificans]|uniref:TRAP-type mannitol/chloroaromatic compound transport system substrate-binding protein n=1 Tax=Thioalbus denitrificans TaxID=547122 RepID=A0A369CHB7_9GAMM|nr:TRAP transporter substrate-binding protein [Thioalbus denitrificans]RCX31234.1 TRAP-type mannitol/chloroaromatic compound transport system substrate-binding protein [Thioalbus denitrificans]